MHFEQDHDHTTTIPLTPVLRVSWSRQRAWHGETVSIRVRSANVQPASVIELRIGPVGAPAFDTVLALALNAGALDHNYVIDWRPPQAVPAGATDFVVVARLPAYNVDSAPSAPMQVDLSPPMFSA